MVQSGTFLDIEYKGWISMFGAFNLAMLVGQNYVWGAIGEYVISWFYHGSDPTVKTSQAITVIPITWLALNIMSFVGPRAI